jgi:hypothetical protein
LVSRSLSLITEFQGFPMLKTLWGLVQAGNYSDGESKNRNNGGIRAQSSSPVYAVAFTPGLRSSSKFFFVPEIGLIPLPCQSKDEYKPLVKSDPVLDEYLNILWKIFVNIFKVNSAFPHGMKLISIGNLDLSVEHLNGLQTKEKSEMLYLKLKEIQDHEFVDIETDLYKHKTVAAKDANSRCHLTLDEALAIIPGKSASIVSDDVSSLSSTSSSNREQMIKESENDILQVKSFLIDECELSQAASKKYAEIFVVDHDLYSKKKLLKYKESGKLEQIFAFMTKVANMKDEHQEAISYALALYGQAIGSSSNSSSGVISSTISSSSSSINNSISIAGVVEGGICAIN